MKRRGRQVLALLLACAMLTPGQAPAWLGGGSLSARAQEEIGDPTREASVDAVDEAAPEASEAEGQWEAESLDLAPKGAPVSANITIGNVTCTIERENAPWSTIKTIGVNDDYVIYYDENMGDDASYTLTFYDANVYVNHPENRKVNDKGTPDDASDDTEYYEFDRFIVTKRSEESKSPSVFEVKAKKMDGAYDDGLFGKDTIEFRAGAYRKAFPFCHKRLVSIPLGTDNLSYDGSLRTWDEGTDAVGTTDIRYVSGIAGQTASAMDVAKADAPYWVVLELNDTEKTEWADVIFTIVPETEEGVTLEKYQRLVHWWIKQDVNTERGVPTGLSGQACRSVAGKDGYITGLTYGVDNGRGGINDQMEYLLPEDLGSAHDSEKWKEVTSENSPILQGLSHGTYYVRYKANRNYAKPGKWAEVTVGKYAPAGTLVVGGLVDGKAAFGETLTVRVDGEAGKLVSAKFLTFNWTYDASTIEPAKDKHVVSAADLTNGKLTVTVAVAEAYSQNYDNLDWSMDGITPQTITLDVVKAKAGDIGSDTASIRALIEDVYDYYDENTEDRNGRIVLPPAPEGKTGETALSASIPNDLKVPYYEYRVDNSDYHPLKLLEDDTSGKTIRYLRILADDSKTDIDLYSESAQLGAYYIRVAETNLREAGDEYGPFVVKRRYQVLYDANDNDTAVTGSSVKATNMPKDDWPAAGETISAPASPSRSGFVFAGWYLDAAGTKPYDFSAEVTKPMKLYARWDYPDIQATLSYTNGQAVYGNTLEAKAVALTSVPLIGEEKWFYEWLRDGEVVQEAALGEADEGKGNKYELSSADVGHRVCFRVTARVPVGNKYVNKRNGSFVQADALFVMKKTLEVKPSGTYDREYDGTTTLPRSKAGADGISAKVSVTIPLKDRDPADSAERNIVIAAIAPRYADPYANVDAVDHKEPQPSKGIVVSGWTMSWESDWDCDYALTDVYELGKPDWSKVNAIIHARDQALSADGKAVEVDVARREELTQDQILGRIDKSTLTGDPGKLYLVLWPNDETNALKREYVANWEELEKGENEDRSFYWSDKLKTFVSQRVPRESTYFSVGINGYYVNDDTIYEYNPKAPGTKYDLTTLTNTNGAQKIKFNPNSATLVYPEIEGRNAKGEAQVTVEAKRIAPTISEQAELDQVYWIRYAITDTAGNDVHEKAEIDMYSGLVTLHDVGEFRIKAMVNAVRLRDEKGDWIQYNAAEDYYYLTVVEGVIPESMYPVVVTPHIYDGNVKTGVSFPPAYFEEKEKYYTQKKGSYTGNEPDLYYTLTGDCTATKAGSYEAVATPVLGYAWVGDSQVGGIDIPSSKRRDPVTISWVITKAGNANAAPKVKGLLPTTDTSNDGTIVMEDGTELDTSLEYTTTPNVDSSWKTWDDPDLPPGTYYVRYRGDEDHEPSEMSVAVVGRRFRVTFTTAVAKIAESEEPGKQRLTVYVPEGETLSAFFKEYFGQGGAAKDRLAFEDVPVGYTFRQWMNGETAWDYELDRVRGSITLEAMWGLIEYQIRYAYYRYSYDYEKKGYGYDERGFESTTDASVRELVGWGDLSDGSNLPDTFTVETPLVTLPKPTITGGGYAFVGWTSRELAWTDRAKWKNWKENTGLGLRSVSASFVPAELTGEQLGNLVFTGSFLERAKTPYVVSPEPGFTYPRTQDVVLASDEPEATIYFTTDGTDPIVDHNPFSGTITVAQTATVKAIAVVDGKAVSDVMSAWFGIEQEIETDVAGIILEPEILTAFLSDSPKKVKAKPVWTSEGTQTPTDTKNDSFAADADLSWTNSNPSIATIAQSSSRTDEIYVTPVKAGTTTIMVQDAASKETAKFQVIVKKKGAYVEPTGVQLYATELSLRKGARTTLGYSAIPSNATDIKTTWTSSNPTVATVAKDGTVTALTDGTATITLSIGVVGRETENTKGRATCKVTVGGELSVDSIQIEPKSLTLSAPLLEGATGTAAALMATVYPEDAPNRTVIWGVEEVFGDEHEYLTFHGDSSTGTTNYTVIANYVKGAVYPRTINIKATVEGTSLKATIPCTITQSVTSEDLVLYPGTAEGNETEKTVWVGALGSYPYTGSKITPRPNVYYDRQLLTEGTDYTLSWKYNTDAADESSAYAPRVYVNLKGSYRGTLERRFTITPLHISAAEVVNPSAAVNGRERLLKPTVTYQGKKLRLGKDYQVIYDAAAVERKLRYVDEGAWGITITGLGNFGAKDAQGKTTRTAAVVLVNKASSINLAKVLVRRRDSGAINYDGTAKTPLYDLYYNNGTVKVDEGAYETTYVKNVNAGKATVIFSPRTKECYGKKQVSFTIEKRNLETLFRGDDKTGSVNWTLNGGAAVVYAKGGVKPPVDIRVNLAGPGSEMTLVKGTDYTLSYQTGSKIPPMNGWSVTIKGKGNYRGTYTYPFPMERQDLGNLMLVVDDFNYVERENAYQKVKLTVYDLNGKALKRGENEDYIVHWNPGSGVPSVGSSVSVVLEGRGPYKNELQGSFKVIDKSMRLDAAKVSFYRRESNYQWVPYSASQFYMVYDGAPVLLSKDNLELQMNNVHVPSAQYEIVGFLNNDRAGRGTAILKGRGRYGGLKNVKFRILKQGG